MFQPLRTLALAAVWIALFAGCDTRVEKLDEQAAAASTPAVAPAQPGTATPQTAGSLVVAGVRFTPDPAWTDLGASNMRAAHFEMAPVEGDPAPAEIKVFANIGGGVEGNIQRWIGQMQAPDGGDASSVAIRSKLTTAAGLDIHFVEIDGTFKESMGGGPMTGGRTVPRPDYRLVGAIVEGPSGEVFFKLTGPRKTARAMEEGMRQMLAAATEVGG